MQYGCGTKQIVNRQYDMTMYYLGFVIGMKQEKGVSERRSLCNLVGLNILWFQRKRQKKVAQAKHNKISHIQQVCN